MQNEKNTAPFRGKLVLVGHNTESHSIPIFKLDQMDKAQEENNKEQQKNIFISSMKKQFVVVHPVASLIK